MKDFSKRTLLAAVVASATVAMIGCGKKPEPAAAAPAAAPAAKNSRLETSAIADPPVSVVVLYDRIYNCTRFLE